MLLKIVIYLVTYWIIINDSWVETADAEGYYWRDFDGDIPDDAYPAGQDSVGKPIYVAQVYAIYLIPGKIYDHDARIYYEYGGKEHEASINVKILCTVHPEQLQWIPTNNDDIKNLKHKKLIVGGFEPGCSIYIGRTIFDGEMSVGKVLTDNFPIFSGLYVTRNGKIKRVANYEVLAFNKKARLQ